jgi:DNA-binding transcriptional MerR regulator
MHIKSFTISDLERFSGVKAHTLRIWESRYALLQPVRTSGNFRLYTLDELKKILNIALLNKNGCRISNLAKTHTADIENQVRLLPNDDDKWQRAINDLTINMYTLEPASFEWVLDELLLNWPIGILVEKIIYPFLKITRLLWVGNKLYEEHLVVTAIRKKLMFAIETAHAPATHDHTVLLFLPDGKQIDLGLLYSNYFLKKTGMPVLYLGIDVTIQNLKTILQIHQPAYLFTYLPQNHHFPITQLVACMQLHAPVAKLIIGGYYSRDSAEFGENCIQMKYDEALDFLAATIH